MANATDIRCHVFPGLAMAALDNFAFNFAPPHWHPGFFFIELASALHHFSLIKLLSVARVICFSTLRKN